MGFASIGIHEVSFDRASDEVVSRRHNVSAGQLPRDHQAGFTLIETLVALAIFAGMIAVVYDGMAANWRAIRRTEMDAVAMTLANTQFALAGLNTALANGQSFGGRHGEITRLGSVREVAAMRRCRELREIRSKLLRFVLVGGLRKLVCRRRQRSGF